MKFICNNVGAFHYPLYKHGTSLYCLLFAHIFERKIDHSGTIMYHNTIMYQETYLSDQFCVRKCIEYAQRKADDIKMFDACLEDSGNQ